MPFNILIAGSSGLVGSALVPALRSAGYRVVRLVRKNPHLSDDERQWDPSQGLLSAEAFKGIDAVINLAGANIAEHRWSETVKKNILESRVQATRLLAETMAALSSRPQVFMSASAVGFYGDRGTEVLTESSLPGQGFLASVCQQWEAASTAAEEAGIRVIHLRIGTVLAKQGGALKSMLIPFKLGLGGVIGTGSQYLSWVAMEDLVGIIFTLLRKKDIQGAVNAVAPHPATNAEFTKTLAHVLYRPALLPLPAWLARIAFGEMADELLLSSAKALPEKLLSVGFRFGYPELSHALNTVLHKKQQP